VLSDFCQWWVYIQPCFVAEFHDDIRIAIPTIAEGLKGSRWRAAINDFWNLRRHFINIMAVPFY